MWFLHKLRGKMEPLEPESELDNHQQQLPDSRLISDPSINNDKSKMAQLIAQNLANLVLSCKDEVVDRNLQQNSVVIDEEDQVKQPIDDDDVRHLVVKEDFEAVEAESSSGFEEMKFADDAVERRCLEKVLEVDQKEVRVLDELETGESELGCENLDERVEDEDVSSEIVEYERVQDLENERKIVSVMDGGKSKTHQYPLRLDAEDCSYYIRTGMCKFGSSCKFNHPLRRKNQKPAKETKKRKEENVERHGQTECKYHTSSTGCKYRKACKFNHGRGKSKTPVVEYNFVGLPIRPGEKECPYYMRNGSCKHGPSCWFNHPDPTAAGGDDAPTTYGNDGRPPLQPTPQPNIPNVPSWSAPSTPEPTTAFVPSMYPPTQSMPPPNPDWNSYQAPAPVPAHLYPSSEQGLPIPPAFFLNNPPSNTNMYTHHQQPMSVSEYPERPGQPDCSYFMKTGVCKYRASCKFHHPHSRITKTLRDQNICTYFSRHGTCKYGSACKYDHPVNYNSNSNPAGEGYNGSNGSKPLIQQSV